MKKSERLELENKVLKNMLENIRCTVDSCQITGDGAKMAYTLGVIGAIANSYEESMEHAKILSYLKYGKTKNKMAPACGNRTRSTKTYKYTSAV